LVVELGDFWEALARLRIDVRFLRIGPIVLDGFVDNLEGLRVLGRIGEVVGMWRGKALPIPPFGAESDFTSSSHSSLPPS
jgi:hypothetical protein